MSAESVDPPIILKTDDGYRRGPGWGDAVQPLLEHPNPQIVTDNLYSLGGTVGHLILRIENVPSNDGQFSSAEIHGLAAMIRTTAEALAIEEPPLPEEAAARSTFVSGAVYSLVDHRSATEEQA